MSRSVFPNAMVAHVWAQGRQESGRSGNGQFYFEGPALYSYGSHYVAGFRLASGFCLLNAESRSITTTRHVTYAARAARESARVPDLTEWAEILRTAARAAPDLSEWALIRAARLAEGPEPEARPRGASPRVLESLSDRAKAAASDLSPICPRALQEIAAALIGNPAKAERMARKWADRRERNRKEWAALSEWAGNLAKLETAREWAAVRPAALAADLAAVPRRDEWARPFPLETALRQWEGRAVSLFRAAKAAKAAGRTEQARKVSGHYRAIRAAMAQWPGVRDMMESRDRVREMAREIREGRKALALGVPALVMQQAHFAGRRDSVGPRRTLEKAAQRLETMARAVAAVLADGVPETPLARMQCRVMRAAGFLSEAARADLEREAAAMRLALSALKAGSERAAIRADLAALKAWRAARAAGEPVTTETARRAAHAAQNMANRLATWAAPGPNPMRAAGLSADHFRAMRTAAESDRAAGEAAEQAARAAREAAERAARLERDAAALAAWRDGVPGARSGYWKTPAGGAFLRAIVTERDAAGRPVAGTLETSQGAAVPLAHALRAFGFLRKVRESGNGWKAAGRSIPVGHFQIESIDAQGNFRAGCHYIEWAECARVAQEIGAFETPAADLSPADLA